MSIVLQVSKKSELKFPFGQIRREQILNVGGSESLKNDNDRRKDINIQGKDILKTMYI